LHGVFGIFALAADFHAERENGVLQQCQGLFQGLVIAPLQQENRPFDLGSHCGKCSTPQGLAEAMPLQSICGTFIPS
jgi:hypothetical protein